MSAIQNLCSRAVILEQGTVVDAGPSEKMVRRYMTLNSEEYLSDSDSFFSNVKRRGSGKCYFKNFEILDENKTKTSFVIKEGTKCFFKASVAVEEELTEGLQFKVFIKSMAYKDVITCTKTYQIDLDKVVDQKLNLEIAFDNFDLRPGEYILDIWMGSGRSKGKYDQIDGDLPLLTVVKDESILENDYDPNNVQGYFNIDNELNYLSE